MKRVGFVGIGLMGRQITRRLIMAGYPLTIWNRTKGAGQGDPATRARHGRKRPPPAPGRWMW